MQVHENYQAANPQNLFLGQNVTFYQQTIFNGHGCFSIGNNTMFGWVYSPHFFNQICYLVAETPEAIIEIGDGTTLSNDVSIRALGKISIGKNCLVGDRVTIYDADFHEIDPRFRRRSPGPIKPVIIQDNVWIGSNVMIFKGVTIGENAVIAAGSMVTRDVPPNTIVGGNPARLIKEIEIVD